DDGVVPPEHATAHGQPAPAARQAVLTARDRLRQLRDLDLVEVGADVRGHYVNRCTFIRCDADATYHDRGPQPRIQSQALAVDSAHGDLLALRGDERRGRPLLFHLRRPPGRVAG